VPESGHGGGGASARAWRRLIGTDEEVDPGIGAVDRAVPVRFGLRRRDLTKLTGEVGAATLMGEVG
jgi:hypothetical protein